jgi:hypothetical protein
VAWGAGLALSAGLSATMRAAFALSAGVSGTLTAAFGNGLSKLTRLSAKRAWTRARSNAAARVSAGAAWGKEVGLVGGGG